jgi:membrane associated rhomboid family serine protease
MIHLAQVYVNLLFPVPAIGLAAFGFARDVLNSNNAASSTGHAAHIGGAVAGVAAFAFLRGRGGPRSPLLPGF